MSKAKEDINVEGKWKMNPAVDQLSFRVCNDDQATYFIYLIVVYFTI